MKRVFCLLVLAGVVGSAAQPLLQAPDAEAPNPDSAYSLGPDSLARDGVAKGTVRGPSTLPSEAYPGTQHTYWVYVPAQYDPSTAASLMIFNDGQAYMNMEGTSARRTSWTT